MSILMFAKMETEGRGTGLDKSAYHDAIEKLAREIRRDGETSEQSYARAITDSDAGRLLFKAYKAAASPKVPVARLAQPEPDVDGPAEKDMESAVEDHRKAAAAKGKTLSREQAFVAVYTDPAHRGLKDRYDRETLAKRARAG
jgi:hypothetical protein